MSYMRNAQASIASLINNGVVPIAGQGAPTSGTSGTGVGVAGPGTPYYDGLNAGLWFNVGTLASPSWIQIGGPGTTQQLSGSISSTNITGTSAGQLGHAYGVILIPAVAGVAFELVSCSWAYKYSTAAYTGGGNVTINQGGGGAAITGVVSFANSFGASANKLGTLYPLAAAYTALVENGPINMVAASAPTQPGTAAGTINWVINFRTVTLPF